MARTTIHAPLAVIEGRLAQDVAIGVESGRIVDVEAGVLSGDCTRAIDGELLPGLVDLQVNGMRGVGFECEDPAGFDHAARAVRAGGAAAFLPTLITAPIDLIARRAAALSRWIADGAADDAAVPLGIHIEGPFLEIAGAHEAQALVEPTPERIDRLIDACDGRLALVTLAPGLPGALEAVVRLRAASVAVAFGHARQTRGFLAGVDAGAALVTHLFNAMSPIHHRDPGITGLALDDDRLACCLIADGHHVHPAVLRTAWRVLGAERTVLVSDAVSAAGMPDGSYDLSGSPVNLSGGVVRDRSGRLAGSTLTMFDACARFASFVPGIGTIELARIAATNPARAIGATGFGAIAPGCRACFTVRAADGSLRIANA